jgi:putative transposase
VEEDHPELSIRRQCELLGLPRSSFYYEAIPESAENLHLLRLLDEQYLKTPFYGSRRLGHWLKSQGHEVNRKRVRRLMATLGLEAVYPKPKTTVTDHCHRVYPYLLRDLVVQRVDEVWSTDITYVPMQNGFLYLTAVIDWFSRCVLAWRLSNSLDGSFCEEALEEALTRGRPEIFNTDQGCQFTASSFTTRLEDAGVRVSMNGRGRCLDNVFVERLWRTVKYEEIYLRDYANGKEAQESLAKYFRFYCEERGHSSLGMQTPAAVYAGKNLARRSPSDSGMSAK